MSRHDDQLPVTFVIRASRDNTGGVQGTVTRVRTGETAPFAGPADAGRLLAEMLRCDFEDRESRET